MHHPCSALRVHSTLRICGVSWDGVKIWVFGHTHYTTEFKERGISVVSNQRGYVLPWKTEKGNFDVRRVVSKPGFDEDEV
ncbi:hypothetical protein N7517_009879 [Penicillium concentricum]|uniref:Calcineurin-like phosphoesterase domain-containing protein n=1 Tax=Penicillium concentricum TaxID=293559 RepID=A0A9W9RN83_9EURO|nr:uncharacterized protein N7517_009879 [Penicillium concentricum]KAJ5360688.1 hypothetical protein N7517_009879 [Penicillium concentricum]